MAFTSSNMTLSLPEVKPVAINAKPDSDLRLAAADVSSDYGTPNLLFLYYIPFLPDDRKPDLDAIRDEFQTWNAWELGQAEVQLLTHVGAGNLPSDDSIASRFIRNNYRSKAIEFFRASSQAWLSVANTSTGQKIIDSTPAEVNSVILRELRSFATENQLQIQFNVILNIVSSNINLGGENKFYFTHVYYKYDGASRRFIPVVQDTIFTVKTEAGKGGKDRINGEISFAINVYNFDRKFWRENRHQGEAAIEAGEPIRKQMALDFYVNN